VAAHPTPDASQRRRNLAPILGDMKILRMDNVGIVVDDLVAAIAF
jgi:hypothetical protein